MPFQPGVSGNPSGRPKKLLKRVDEVLHARGVHPVDQVLELLRAKDVRDLPLLAPKEQLRAWLDLLSYVCPRLKDVAEEPGENLHALPTAELLSRCEAAVAELRGEVETAGRRKGRGKKAAQAPKAVAK